MEDRRRQLIDRLAADLERRVLAMPHQWDKVSIVDLLLHRHCVDCGMPVVRHGAGGTAFDMGTSVEHRCPEDPGAVFTCECGEPLLVFASGKAVTWPDQKPHRCTWSDRLGQFSWLDQTIKRELPAPEPPAAIKRPGVLDLE